MKHLLALTVLFCAIQLPVHATGILLPKDESLPALAIKHQRVDIDIDNGVATTKIEQVFKSNVDRVLEATYIFPLPEGASIGEFAMYINGKRQTGELVEAQKAREIFEGIVRRMRDPGLLEYIDNQLLKMRVYPIPARGEQRIEVSYTQQLDYEGGTYKMVYPLHTTKAASRTLEDFTIGASIKSKVPIKTIYSPSHDVGISRKGKHQAVVGFEQYQSLLDKDFVLYYGVSEKRFGLNLITHAIDGKDGYFMMMIAPEYDKDDLEVVERDIVFVFDTSGSMAGEKMNQAREALEYCVNKLNKGDRFNIVRFSTDVDTFKHDLVKVDNDSRKAALEYIDDLQARGGTDIDNALTTALDLRSDEKRPFTVIFLTDGKPTIGETNPEDLVERVIAKSEKRTRVFVFGVGEKVNTILLDRIGSETGGHSQYIRPDEDIETEVSAFFDKASQPVLSMPELEVIGLKTFDIYPRKLDDMFHGNQLTLFGRYHGSSDHAVVLKGEINGNAREYTYEYDFPHEQIDNDFIARLWATRKVGFLLEEIRQKGEVPELKDEVILLSKEFGIMTPYTSFLVLETEQDYAKNNIPRTQRDKQAQMAKLEKEHKHAKRATIEPPRSGEAEREVVSFNDASRWAQDGENKDRYAESTRAFAKVLDVSGNLSDANGEHWFIAPVSTASAPGNGPGEWKGLGKMGHPGDGRANGNLTITADAQVLGDEAQTAVVPFFGSFDAISSVNGESSLPALKGDDPESSSDDLRQAPKPKTLRRLLGGQMGGNVLTQEDGAAGLDVSEAIYSLKQAETPDRRSDSAGATRWIGEKLFALINGVWIDSTFTKEMTLKKVTYLSAEYFALMKDDALVKQYLALGERVVFVVDGKTAISIVQ